MSLLTYEEFGETHRVIILPCGKVCKFKRSFCGERWQSSDQHATGVHLMVWKDSLTYMRDQQQWQHFHVGFKFHEKSDFRLFWIKEEIAALRLENGYLRKVKKLAIQEKYEELMGSYYRRSPYSENLSNFELYSMPKMDPIERSDIWMREAVAWYEESNL